MAQPVTNHLALAMPDLPKPVARSSIADPVFGSRLVRLTDSVAAGLPGAFPQYSRRQAWNADETRLLLLSDNGQFSLCDGATYQFLKVLDDVGGEDVFWHPNDPELILYNADIALHARNVETDADTILYQFSTNYAWAHTQGEGNLSRDARYYAVAGQVYDYVNQTVAVSNVVVVDLVAQQEIGSLLMPTNLASFDWVSISPLGNYVVVDYASTGTGPFEGVEVYDRCLTNRLWQKPLGYGHSDLGVDANGDEILVIVIYDEDANQEVLKAFRLRDGRETTLLAMDYALWLHVSCQNERRSEWCFISTYDSYYRLTDDPVSWLPFEDEIFAVKLDGSGQVQRLAHHHSRRYSPAASDVYWAEPHATVSRKANRILFGSNWRQNVTAVNSVDAYICDFAQVIAPSLTYRLSGRHLFLSWPAADSGYTLESATALGLGGWVPASEAATVTNDWITVTVDLPATTRFFRLKNPL